MLEIGLGKYTIISQEYRVFNSYCPRLNVADHAELRLLLMHFTWFIDYVLGSVRHNVLL